MGRDNAALTDAEAVYAYEQVAAGRSISEVARELGVSESVPRRICSGERYGHLDLAPLTSSSESRERQGGQRERDSEIVTALRQRTQGLATSQLATLLTINETTVRRAMVRMRTEGRVQCRYVTTPGDRGRPRQVWTVSDEG